jgi:hypothetical protein
MSQRKLKENHFCGGRGFRDIKSSMLKYAKILSLVDLDCIKLP